MAKTALVTGGARGIGRDCALALADAGFDIAIVDLLEADMTATARDIAARGPRTLTFHRCERLCPRPCDRQRDHRRMGATRRAPLRSAARLCDIAIVEIRMFSPMQAGL
jgi:NAD(P)-dependent dehydrogenase (short-subunit alcohol dehydrogenase family)